MSPGALLHGACQGSSQQNRGLQGSAERRCVRKWNGLVENGTGCAGLPWHAVCIEFPAQSRRFSTPDTKETAMIEKGKGGEGNREADRRYRKGVSETVEHTSEKERSEKARNMSGEVLDKARQAEEKGKSRARK
jgi:hypothetical protein